MNPTELVNYLINLAEGESHCDKFSCTTCGGLGRAIHRNLTPDIKSGVRQVLEKFTADDFFSVGKSMCYFLRYIAPTEVRSIFDRAALAVDRSDVRQLDRFLMRSRSYYKDSDLFDELVTAGKQLALTTKDESLVETLAIILGDKLPRHGGLHQLALEMMRENTNIQRVLYNTLREVNPEVRGFVGDGSTRYYW